MAEKIYVRLKDTSTVLFDTATKTVISGKKPVEVIATPYILRAHAKGVLLNLTEKQYKAELEEYERKRKAVIKTEAVPEKPVPVQVVVPPPEVIITQPPVLLPDVGEEKADKEKPNSVLSTDGETQEVFERRLAAMTGEKLIALADEKKVAITGLKTKAEIAAKIVSEVYKN